MHDYKRVSCCDQLNNKLNFLILTFLSLSSRMLMIGHMHAMLASWCRDSLKRERSFVWCMTCLHIARVLTFLVVMGVTWRIFRLSMYRDSWVLTCAMTCARRAVTVRDRWWHNTCSCCWSWCAIILGVCLDYVINVAHIIFADSAVTFIHACCRKWHRYDPCNALLYRDIVMLS